MRRPRRRLGLARGVFWLEVVIALGGYSRVGSIRQGARAAGSGSNRLVAGWRRSSTGRSGLLLHAWGILPASLGPPCAHHIFATDQKIRRSRPSRVLATPARSENSIRLFHTRQGKAPELSTRRWVDVSPFGDLTGVGLSGITVAAGNVDLRSGLIAPLNTMLPASFLRAGTLPAYGAHLSP